MTLLCRKGQGDLCLTMTKSNGIMREEEKNDSIWGKEKINKGVGLETQCERKEIRSLKKD